MKTNHIILLVLIILFSINVIIAGISLTPVDSILPIKEKADLSKLGIKKVTIQEYECSDKQRCFNLTGDVNDKLINIPNQVFDRYETIDTKVNRTIIIKGRPVTRETIMRVRTGKILYRNITDEEVMNILSKSSKYKLDKLIPKEETKTVQKIKYNPIVILDEK